LPHFATLCQRWQIAEQSLFGSVLGDRFHPNSDIDILNIALKEAMGDSENWIRHLAFPIFGRSPPHQLTKKT
jgi:predicted nucleotidyltransferase